MNLKKLSALLLTLAILITMLPVLPAMAEDEITSAGISFTKTACLKADGTVDITMEAYTTGRVTVDEAHVR